MTAAQTPSHASLEILPASPEQQPILANLLELYAYDFSQFIELQLGADARFGYPQLPLYWKEPQRHPFLVKVNGHWAGLVFTRQGSQISGDENIWDMAEFFIVRSYRRRGVGREVAHEVWRRFPGKWEVRVMDRNPQAREFWKHAISEFIGRKIKPVAFDKNGAIWHVFSFESGRAA